MQKLNKTLAALRRASEEGSHALLRHIYSKHPPKNKKHRLAAEPSTDNTKQLLSDAILHYQPDPKVGGPTGG